MIRKDTRTPMFAAALLTTAKTWKQFKRPLRSGQGRRAYAKWNTAQPLQGMQ